MILLRVTVNSPQHRSLSFRIAARAQDMISTHRGMDASHHRDVLGTTLQWRHNDHGSVSNHQPHGCLLNRLFRRRSKKTSKLRGTGLCVGNSPRPVNSLHKGPVTRKMFPFDDVIMILKYVTVDEQFYRGPSSKNCNQNPSHDACSSGYTLQYIPRNMHTVFALLCFVVVIHWLIFPYPSGLLHWHCGNLTIAPVPAKQPWWIWINTSFAFIMNDYITTTKQSTTKPCAYFLGYTVSCMHAITELHRKPINVTDAINSPDSKIYGANMGHIWGRQDPGGPHVGPMNLTIWEWIYWLLIEAGRVTYLNKMSANFTKREWLNQQQN